MKVKSILEGLVVVLVIVLSGFLIGLIAYYVQVARDDVQSGNKSPLLLRQTSKTDAVQEYVKKLEGYQEDDVQTDNTRQIDEVNIQETTVEVHNDDIVNAIEEIVEESLNEQKEQERNPPL